MLDGFQNIDRSNFLSRLCPETLKQDGNNILFGFSYPNGSQIFFENGHFVKYLWKEQDRHGMTMMSDFYEEEKVCFPRHFDFTLEDTDKTVHITIHIDDMIIN
jgi:hypothetical protein